MQEITNKNVFVQNIINKSLADYKVEVYVLRLDKIHPIISGNKWFKLKFYLREAIQNNATALATFGGAYSNHIVATAHACYLNNLKSIGVIRGERSESLSKTLEEAESYGMKLYFVSRNEFSNKKNIQEKFKSENWYWVNEGGYGKQGALGAAEIFEFIDETYTHIVCACGTGTTMAGLIKAANTNQQVIGINVLKGYDTLLNDVKELLSSAEQLKNFQVFNDFHFGGYAKHPKELIEFMNEIWRQYQLPTDIVYTSKLMYAFFDLLSKNYFSPESKIMIIHSGGLQGNQSLAANTLSF